MDIKNFKLALEQIAEEKGISIDKVKESIETAIAAAYKKDYGKKSQIIRCQLDFKTGEFKFWQIRIVVSKDMVYFEEEEPKTEEQIRFNPERHILLKEAQKIDSEVEPEQEIEIELKPEQSYRRIAAQTAKQVILQKIREAERSAIFQEYKNKEGEIISGILQRVEYKNIYVDIGKTLGVLPKEEQVYGEFYKPGQRMKFFVLKVEENSKNPIIILSRAHPRLVSKLFELEVPEINQGTIKIKSIARDPGSRSKIAVISEAEDIDPIGSTVGQKGTRVSAVINELGGEKIDIVEYVEDSEQFIINALSPAKILEVKILPKNKALCLIPEDQLSLAIGRDGQNVRLAAKLTGWNIDVEKTSEEKQEEDSSEEKQGEGQEEDSSEEKQEEDSSEEKQEEGQEEDSSEEK